MIFVLNKDQLKIRTKYKKTNIKIKPLKKKSNIDSEDLLYPINKVPHRTIKVVHLNIKGLTKVKFYILRKLFKDTDVITLQKTHIPESETKRLKNPIFNMVDYKGHHKHKLAMYVSQKIEDQYGFYNWKWTFDYHKYKKPI